MCWLFIYCYNVNVPEIKKVTKWRHFEVAMDITFDITAVLVLISSPNINSIIIYTTVENNLQN